MTHGLTGRAVMQKDVRLDLPRLRKSAEHAPQCFYCHRSNHDKTCVLAHDNWHGKGVHLKTSDPLGAIVCQHCHDLIDGRAGNLPVEDRKEMHGKAHRATLVWWINEGYLVLA